VNHDAQHSVANVYGTGRAKFGGSISLRNSRGYKRGQSVICPELGKMQPRNG
jgi:hypothetical protein